MTQPTLEEVAVSDHDCPGIHAWAPPLHFACTVCTWHGAVPDHRPPALGEEQGAPLCPGCGAAVKVLSSAELLYAQARRAERAQPGYEAMLRWSEGRSYPDFDTLQNAFRQAMAGEL